MLLRLLLLLCHAIVPFSQHCPHSASYISNAVDVPLLYLPVSPPASLSACLFLCREVEAQRVDGDVVSCHDIALHACKTVAKQECEGGRRGGGRERLGGREATK